MINTSPPNSTEYVGKQRIAAASSQMHHQPPPNIVQQTNSQINGNGLSPNGLMAPMSPSQHQRMAAAAAIASGNMANDKQASSEEVTPSSLEKDYYGCYCLKFIVKNGTHITEEKVLEDFGQFGKLIICLLPFWRPKTSSNSCTFISAYLISLIFDVFFSLILFNRRGGGCAWSWPFFWPSGKSRICAFH